VLSPSNWVDDRRVKFGIYEAAQVPEFWIVDPFQETVEVFVLDAEGRYTLLDRFSGESQLRSHVLIDFSIPVTEVFPQ
jgi:Uma2 family endonuclease